MNRQYPIYTVENKCQDCYKCVRHCPVKAIRVIDGRASLVPELCVACGRCVLTCPAGAKRVRDDLGRARHLVERRRDVYVSLAPSWVSEFGDVKPRQMISALRRLGFAGVGETAVGAEQVSAGVAEMLREGPSRVALSSACPVCVGYVQKYHPELTEAITPLLSPALTHAGMLRAAYGDGIAVVFIGPCIAKKLEADNRPDLLDIALTFEDLRAWLAEEDVEFDEGDLGGEELRFVLTDAEEGALYPIEGGMVETVRAQMGEAEVECVTVSGMGPIARSLEGLDASGLSRPLFIECLACEGGCVNGPASSVANPLVGRMRVSRYAPPPASAPRRAVETPLAESYEGEDLACHVFSPEQIAAALGRVGKTSAADELNCGGCGYDTCRAFAIALLENKAEPSMCVSYMRRLAMRKANALLRCMPCGVVVVDADLRVIESNEPFARLSGEETMLAYEASDNLAGARLEKLLPLGDLFRAALESGQDIRREHLHVGGRLLTVTIFTIEQGQTVGAIIEDVTQSELRREQISRKAREVIDRNISTVQDIACRLGEHMADTEILLRSIADDYADHVKPDVGEGKG